MRRTFLFLAAASALLYAPLVAAAAVEAVQPPAWAERSGQREPLRPGMTLGAGDAIETGNGGRLLLRLGDGGLIRVGSGARLRFESLDATAASGSTAVVEAGRGAVHYTGGSGRGAAQTVTLSVAATRIAVHGADLWVGHRDGVTTVCLIAGEARVQHPARGEFVMDQAPGFFVAPAEGEPHPVAPADAGQLAAWTAETDLQLGQGVMLPGGGWIVQLGSYEREADARRVARQLLDAGLPVEVTTVQLRDRSFYRLRIVGFDARQDARAFAARTRPLPGMPDPWVTCEIPGRSCE